MAGLFPAILRRFSLPYVSMAAENLLVWREKSSSIRLSPVMNTGSNISQRMRHVLLFKNVMTAPYRRGDCTCYDGPVDPAAFERNNDLFNCPEFGSRLVIGKFCSIAGGVFRGDQGCDALRR